MAKILVVSDSHGMAKRLEEILVREYPCDCLVHCGDGARDTSSIPVPPDLPVLAVSGNMDGLFRDRYPAERHEEIGGVRFMIVHGDAYGAHRDLDALLRQGARTGADVVLFGHTHLPFLGKARPVLFNPGAVMKGCYGVITTGEGIGFEHRTIHEL